MLLLLIGCAARSGVELDPGQYLLPVPVERVEVVATCLGSDVEVVEFAGGPAVVGDDESFAQVFYLAARDDATCEAEVPTREFEVQIQGVDVEAALEAASQCLTGTGTLTRSGAVVSGSDRYLEASRAESALRHYVATGRVSPCEGAPLVVAYE